MRPETPGPFEVRRQDRVLTLRLDTPRSPVNVFTVDAARQLTAEIADTTPTNTDAVVVRSGKRGSFVNGAQLMLANVAKSREDVARLTQPVRTAYRALRAVGVPTVCVIEGSCFGCGLELSLHTDYRLASNAYETRFHLTEIADYLLVPNFGATQDLPRLISFEHALDLLLWGDYWGSAQAVDTGLVDAAFPADALDEGLAELIDAVRAGREPRPRHRRWDPSCADIAERARTRILELPQLYQPSYLRALELAVAAAQKDRLTDADYDAEVTACAETLVRPEAKAALMFFFSRQSAALASVRPLERSRPRGVTIRGDETRDASTFGDELARRRVPDIELLDEVDVESTRVHLRWQDRPTGSRPVVYAPCFALRPDFIEVADPGSGDEGRKIVDALQGAGFSAVRSTASDRFVTNELLLSFFAPMAALGSAAGVHEVLRGFGFSRSPQELLSVLPAGHVAVQLDGWGEAGQTPPVLLDSILGSLLRFADRAERERWVPHRTILDLAARELLDFPHGVGAMTRWLAANRARLEAAQ